jgi:hypothetical protein
MNVLKSRILAHARLVPRRIQKIQVATQVAPIICAVPQTGPGWRSEVDWNRRYSSSGHLS